MRRRSSLITPAMFALAALCGCQAPRGPVFPAIDPPIVWPRPPETPRIRYVGQLTGGRELGAHPPGWSPLRALIAGPPPQRAFSTPTAVAVDGPRVYVADGQMQCVHVLDLEARTIDAISNAGGSPLLWPSDVAIAGEHLVVADSRAAAVHWFDLAGRHLESTGAGEFIRPAAVAWHAPSRRLWVVDAGAHACILLGRDSLAPLRIGTRGSAAGEFNYPAGLAARDEAIAIADSMNFRIQVLSPEGTPRLVFGRKGDAAGDFSLPRDVAYDSDNHLYVLDSQFENVQIFDPQGRLLLAFGREGNGPGEFWLPSGITIDAQDRIWIADTYNRRVQVFQYLKQEAES